MADMSFHNPDIAGRGKDLIFKLAREAGFGRGSTIKIIGESTNPRPARVSFG